jgi:hypothetical protein
MIAESDDTIDHRGMTIVRKTMTSDDATIGQVEVTAQEAFQ